MDLISVIVPFFNSEKTLGFCIDSITNQTYKKIELLLIDDGSKDASVVICNKYIEKDDENLIEIFDNLDNKNLSTYDKIKKIFQESIVPIDKAYLVNKCPDISTITIERNLNKLLKENYIIKVAGGRYTKYKWNDNK